MLFSKNSILVFLFTINQFISIAQSISYRHVPQNEQTLEYIQRKIEEDIKEGKFHAAETLIDDNHYDAKTIGNIVTKIWQNNINRNPFQMIFAFALSTSKLYIALDILRQLSNLLASSQPNVNFNASLIDNCEIYRAIDEKIRNNFHNEDENLIKESKKTLEKIRVLIVDTAVLQLKVHLKENHLEIAKDLANKVLMANESVFDETICKVINETYNDERFRDLIENIWKLDFTTQKAAALICIYQNLNRNWKNNRQAINILGDYLNHLKNLRNFQYLSEYKLNAINEIIDRLPLAVKETYFNNKRLNTN